METLFGLAAGIVGVSGYVPYICDILSLKVKPERSAWTIWALEYTVLFLAQWAKGANGSLWLVGLQLAGVLAVSALSLRFGEGIFDRRSKMLLLCVGLALGLWYITSNAVIALIISLAVEATGAILTVAKAYRDPKSETLTLWILIGTAGLLGIPAVGHADPILYIYPLSLILMNFSVVGAIVVGRRRDRQPEYAPVNALDKALPARNDESGS